MRVLGFVIICEVVASCLTEGERVFDSVIVFEAVASCSTETDSEVVIGFVAGKDFVVGGYLATEAAWD